MQYLVTMTTQVPDGTSEGSVQDVRNREAARSGQLAAQGQLLRLWRPPLEPGEWRTLGLFAAQDEAELENVLASMPLRVWRTDEVTPLLPHPNDPARQTGKSVPPAPGPGGREFLTTSAVTVPAVHLARSSPPPPGTRPIGTGSWPGRDTCSGCGRCPARAGSWASGRLMTPLGCRRS